MRLYFLRHGIAVDADDGRKEMEREAKAIAKLDLKLERIVTSPLSRARGKLLNAARAASMPHALPCC